MKLYWIIIAKMVAIMNKGENFKKWEMGKNQKRTKQYKLIKLYKIRFLVFFIYT